MAANPQFAAIVKVGVATLALADASRTAPANAQTALAAGTSGTRLSKITIQATGTTTAGMVRLFLHDGVGYHLFYEQVINAVTASATLKAESYVLSEALNPDLMPKLIPNGWSLRASTEKAEGFKVIAEGGDL